MRWFWIYNYTEIEGVLLSVLCVDEFAKLRAMPACMPTWSTCQCACVPAWFTWQRAYVATCQKRANF